jgi:hypothetical protein
MIRLTTILLLLILSSGQLQAELVYHGNSADRIYHEGLRVNPALAAWQPVAFEAEWRLMHLGLGDSPAAYGEGGFSFSMPRYGLAIVAVHRDTDLLAESELWLSWAYIFRNTFSLGIQAGVRRMGWNLSHSGQSVIDDPVFKDGSDRLQPDIGVGAFWEISDSWRMGFSLRHLNHPSLSLVEADPHVPARVNLGLEFSMQNVRIGLSIDNDDFSTSDAGLFEEISGDLSPMFRAHWLAVEELEIDAGIRKELISAGMALSWNTIHQIRYELKQPLGDLADQAGASHQLRYRFDIAGGMFIPNSYNPDLVPWSDRDNLRKLFGLSWDPAKITFLFELESPRIELLELHVQLDDSLQSMINTSMIKMKDILGSESAASQSVAPRKGGELRDTYSRKYFQLAGLLEELAVENGIVPVIHAGDKNIRIEDIATLAGIPVEARDSQTASEKIPGKINPVPDSLRINMQLPSKLERAIDHWEVTFDVGGVEQNSYNSKGRLPARLAMSVRDSSGQLPDTGNGKVNFRAFDSKDRLIVSRELQVRIVRRVRNINLRIYNPELDMQERIDEIHIHMNEE